MRLAPLPLLCALACASTIGAEPEPGPGPEPAGTPTGRAAPAKSDPPTPAPEGQLPGRYGCRDDPHAAKQFRDATLELAGDGRFTLELLHVDPEGGHSLSMKGSYRTASSIDHFDDGRWAINLDVVLRPREGLETRWRGDAHRHAHDPRGGHALEERGPASTHERSLPVTLDGAGEPRGIWIEELDVAVHREDPASSTFSPCTPRP